MRARLQHGAVRREIIGIGEDAIGLRPIRSETRARLVEGIARARSWLDELLARRVESLQTIAEREGCSERSVRLTLNLACWLPRS